MIIQQGTLKSKLFFDEFYNNKTIFYKKCDHYYYSRVKTFGRLFDILVIELGIFKPELTQVPKNIWNDSCQNERLKMKIIRDSIWMGLDMLNERADEFFNLKEVKPELPLMPCFYITQKSIDAFINEILIPLLKLVETGNDYNWKKIQGKMGYWCELTDYKDICNNDSILYVDENTGKKLIKLS